MFEPMSSTISDTPYRICRTAVGTRIVSTIQLPHRPWRTKPFETCVTGDDSEELTRRYETLAEAEAGHAEVVAQVSTLDGGL
jgi:hypothetical protein